MSLTSNYCKFLLRENISCFGSDSNMGCFWKFPGRQTGYGVTNCKTVSDACNMLDKWILFSSLFIVLTEIYSGQVTQDWIICRSLEPRTSCSGSGTYWTLWRWAGQEVGRRWYLLSVCEEWGHPQGDEGTARLWQEIRRLLRWDQSVSLPTWLRGTRTSNVQNIKLQIRILHYFEHLSIFITSNY